MTQMNLSVKQKQNYRHREQTGGYQAGGGVGGGVQWEVGVSRCRLLYVEWIDNKVLLYSTENYIQYPMINQTWFLTEAVYSFVRELASRTS